MLKIENNRLGTKTQCWLCSKPPDGITTFEDHHILPKHLGGTNGPLVYLCADCHTNVHKCATKLLKGLSYVPYSENSLKIKCLELAKVIVNGTIALEKNPVNKIYVYSGIFDYATHNKLIELVKYLKTPNSKISQDSVIKLAIKELHAKFL